MTATPDLEHGLRPYFPPPGFTAVALDPANEVTPTNTIAVTLADGHIGADCSDCGATAVWSLDEAEFAAERVRRHPDECRLGAS